MRVPTKLLPIIIIVLLFAAVWPAVFDRPRVWQVSELPIAWWAWRTAVPTEAELNAAAVRTLFLRAGQIDYQSGQLRRIRAAEGALPRGVELHLVYNATRPLLAAFERIEPHTLAAVLADSLMRDWERLACGPGALAGVQLDLDVPVRLLPRYRLVLVALRQRLPPGLKLSITGLPAWMEAPALREVLATVDWWIPQFYGASLPQRVTQNIPLASARQVARRTVQARQLGSPFYAGLAAYGYAILYSTEGKLLELRGDLDPALIADHPDLELIERRPFEATEAAAATVASEWRYLYRVRRECVLDGLVVKPGEMLLLDVPSAANLRACAREVRAQGGAVLRGICIFRLPGKADPTTLANAEIAAALADQDAQPAAHIKLIKGHALNLELVNAGTASGLLGEGAMAISLRVPAGSISGVAKTEGFSRLESLCVPPGAAHLTAAQPCNPRRANLIRLSSQSWRPGQAYRAELLSESLLPETLAAEIAVYTDDGSTWQDRRIVSVTERKAQ